MKQATGDKKPLGDEQALAEQIGRKVLAGARHDAVHVLTVAEGWRSTPAGAPPVAALVELWPPAGAERVIVLLAEGQSLVGRRSCGDVRQRPGRLSPVFESGQWKMRVTPEGDAVRDPATTNLSSVVRRGGALQAGHQTRNPCGIPGAILIPHHNAPDACAVDIADGDVLVGHYAPFLFVRR